MQKVGESTKIEARMDETLPELRYLDELSRKEDICESLKVEPFSDIDVLAVKIIRRAYKGTQIASCSYC